MIEAGSLIHAWQSARFDIEFWLWILVSALAGILCVEIAMLASDPLIAGSPTEVTVPITDKLDEQSWLGLAGR